MNKAKEYLLSKRYDIKENFSIYDEDKTDLIE